MAPSATLLLQVLVGRFANNCKQLASLALCRISFCQFADTIQREGEVKKVYLSFSSFIFSKKKDSYSSDISLILCTVAPGNTAAIASDHHSASKLLQQGQS